MKTRILTGLIIAAIWAAVAFLSIILEGTLSFVFDIFVFSLAIICTLEIMRIIKTRFAKPMELLVLISVALAFAAYFAFSNFGPIALATYALPAFVAIIAVGIIISFVLPKFHPIYSTQHSITTTFSLIYPSIMLTFMMALNYIPFLNMRAAAILLLFFAAPLTDTFAYAFGSIIRGPLLAPKISPKKTIAGAIGGLFGGIVAGLIVFLFLHLNVSFFSMSPITNLDILHLPLMGLIASVFTQCGDLLASMIKRRAGAKDFGTLLPGHGGVMDRVDGMILAAVSILFYSQVLMLIRVVPV